MNLRLFLLITIFSLSTAVVKAQWGVGLTAGYTYNTYDIKTQYDYDRRYDGLSGFSIGVPVQYSFNDWFALVVEPSYIRKGFKINRSLVYTDCTEYDYYVSMPLMARFSFGGNRLRGFFNGGVFCGYWLKSYYTGYNYSLDKNLCYYAYNQDREFLSERDNRFEAGFVGGLGMIYKFAKKWSVLAECRYYYSTTSQTKDYMRVKMPRYNSTLALQVGIMYEFGKDN